MNYTIKFDFADDPRDPMPYFYAGMAGDSLGLAPSLDTALLWNSREVAERFLVNGYGKLGQYGEVIEVPA